MMLMRAFWARPVPERALTVSARILLLALPGRRPVVTVLSGVPGNLRGTVWQAGFWSLFESHDKPTSMEPGQAPEKEACTAVLQAAFLPLFPALSPWQPHTVLKRAEGKVSGAFLYSGLISFDIPNRMRVTR